MTVHLLHELIAIRAQLDAASRMYSYIGQQAGRQKGSGQTPLAIDCARKSTDMAVGTITDWLQAQIIGLYEPADATEHMAAMRKRDSEPEPDGT
jgi:hypothetical protein